MDRAPREQGVVRKLLILLLASATALAGRIETIDVSSGDPAIASRKVRIWLPPGYETNQKRYPVLYFHDGQNVFRPGGPFGCWFAEDTAEREMASGRVRGAILVAVENNPADLGMARMTEYQPPEDTNPRDPGRGPGRCDRYAKFLLENVKPAIDAKYRTLPDRDNTLVAGSSMGGLVSLWLALHTDAFGAAGVFSPAFWTSPNFSKSLASAPKKNGLRIYMDIGTKESGNLSGDYWRDAVAARDALQSRGYTDGNKLLWNPGEGDEHNEKAWAKRLPAALRFFLPPEK